ncbi:MAG: hypothetical protein KDK99_06115 [Verrucomicrobiales bacterium]|nr:hypothetical protein [Verrucomicrobiales bacterium]
MKPTPDLAWLPDADGMQAWRVRAREGKAERESGLRKAPAWVGLATRDLAFVPMRFMSADRAQQEGAARLELETAGWTEADLGDSRMDVFPVDPTGRDASALVVVAPGGLPPGADLPRVVDACFAPAVKFHPMEGGRLVLSQEAGRWVMAISHESGSLLYAQGMSSMHLDRDAAAELRCVLAGLELQDLPVTVREVVVETSEDATAEMLPEFAEILGLPVRLAELTQPTLPPKPTRLAPDAVMEARHARRQLRVALTTMSFVIVGVVLALGVFAAKIYFREQAMMAETERLEALEPQLEEIRLSQQLWNGLGGSIERDQYAVEIVHQLVELMKGSKSVRLTRIELVNNDTLILGGEASSVSHAVEFKGKLISSPYFRDWGFDQGFTSRPTPSGTATIQAEGKRNAMGNQAGPGLVAAQ